MKKSPIICLVGVTCRWWAADPPKNAEPKAFTMPEKAGPDYKISGGVR